ncbi:MAG TPA: MurR/RpiR family transcriptional regulator [Caulobacteraceae bacterium]|jgi:DNA-binding MurR/RpiR family transcriptional regulator
MAGIEEAIRRDLKTCTPAEQKLANYFLNHLRELPFETAASIGRRLEVSPMTVGRYLRKLGYARLDDIKQELRAAGWRAAPATGETFASDPLKAKIKALTDVYQIPDSPEWPRIVSRLAHASAVYVASFEVGRYIGLGFAAFLQNLRPRVHFAETGDGAFADILLDPDPDLCLVLIDARRYARNFRLLAEEAAARGVRTVILTDVYCHWARAVTDDVLMIETEFGVRSLSMLQVLMELLLSAVAAELKGAESRIEAVVELRKKFTGFAEGE